MKLPLCVKRLFRNPLTGALMENDPKLYVYDARRLAKPVRRTDDQNIDVKNACANARPFVAIAFVGLHTRPDGVAREPHDFSIYTLIREMMKNEFQHALRERFSLPALQRFRSMQQPSSHPLPSSVVSSG